MNKKQETVADIVAEMKAILKQERLAPIKMETVECGHVTIFGKPVGIFLHELADRIEAAYKREVGNGAKMREALEDAKKSAFEIIDALRTPCRVNLATNIANYITGVCSQALAAPPRYCDAISEDVMKERFRKEFEDEIEKGLPIFEGLKALVVDVATDTITSLYATYEKDEAEQEEGGGAEPERKEEER